MKYLGAYEAKTHLSKILAEVAKGKQFAITKHGVPVALIVPPPESVRRPVSELVDEMKEFRKKHRLSAKELRAMINEGRK